MLNSLPVRLLWRSLNWFTRRAIVALVVTAVLAGLTIIILRYWLLPNIEQHHDRITFSLASAIGNPVAIGKIDGDWQGLRPRLSFSKVRILDEQGQVALMLPEITASVSWLSLFTAQLRLSSLEIDEPELLIRRDARGNVYIGGVAFSKQSGDGDLADWLLRQSRMVVRNATITWLDEQRAAPPLILKKVNLRIESLFSHHKFAMRAVPQGNLSTPLDVRGDFYGKSFDALGEWYGQLFTQLDHTDIAAWRSWLDLPREFNRGRGAVRGWFGLKNGRITQVTADLILRDVSTKLAEDAPEMTLLNVRGRAVWNDLGNGTEISTKRLAVRLQNGVELQPTDFYFRTTLASNTQPAFSEMRANQLQLESLAGMANFMPIGTGLRNQLRIYAPKGNVSNLDMQWQGAIEKPASYKIKGKFENLAVRKSGDIPGFSGLTVDVDGSEASGKLDIKSHQLSIDATGMMREPLFFASLAGKAIWQRKGGEVLFSADNIAVSNDDLAGNLHGSYQTQADTLGILDLTVALARGDARRAARYTPFAAMGKGGNDWLHGALLAGQVKDLHLHIRQNLSNLPLDKTKDTLFELTGRVQDVVVEFDKKWPRIENVSGEVLIRGDKLEVKSPSATTLGMRLQNLTITLPDMMSGDLPLEIKGEAAGASNFFLQYIQQSPVRGYIEGVTDGVNITGNGHLDLSIHIPLLAENETPAQNDTGGASAQKNEHADKQLRVFGILRMQDNDIDFGAGIPLLRKTTGELVFSESSIKASNVTSQILGGTASINIQTGEGGSLHAAVKGRSNLDAFRESVPHHILSYLRGGAAWEVDINVLKKSAQVVISSNLQGISSSLPPPFSKLADEEMPLRLEKKNITDGQDVVVAQLGKLLNARLMRKEENGVMVVKRGTVKFGDQGKSVEAQSLESLRGKDGVRIIGNLPLLSLQGWGALSGATESHSPALPISGINLSVDKLVGYGQTVNGVRIDAVKRGSGLFAQLSGNTLNGEVIWQPNAFESNDKFTVRLRSLQWQGDESPSTFSSGKPGNQASSLQSDQIRLRPDNLPALEISIESLQIKGKQIGRFELVGHPEGRDWRLRRLHVTNPDASITGDGVWRVAQSGTQTQANFQLEIGDAGKILARSGYPNTVKGGSGVLQANLAWAGRPDEFNYATLDGTLKLDTNKGQFLKMDPGIGKLLSIVSLQALPKRITLDFTDIFSDGFQFDNINGNAEVRHGVIDTQDFHIDGSSAKITMKGNIDLNREAQNLQVVILPTLGEGISLISALAAGPVVGISSLIVNKILGNPLDKMASFEYNISGTWADPNVVKVGEIPANAKKNKFH